MPVIESMGILEESASVQKAPAIGTDNSQTIESVESIEFIKGFQTEDPIMRAFSDYEDSQHGSPK